MVIEILVRDDGLFLLGPVGHKVVKKWIGLGIKRKRYQGGFQVFQAKQQDRYWYHSLRGKSVRQQV
jgi:hypothetical protein